MAWSYKSYSEIALFFFLICFSALGHRSDNLKSVIMNKEEFNKTVLEHSHISLIVKLHYFFL